MKNLFVLGLFVISPLYAQNEQILKPHHIQQDKIDGCSLAAFLMVLNSNSEVTWTQEEMRQFLKSGSKTLRYWYGRVRGRGRGVSLSRLTRYLPQTLKELDIKASVTRYTRKYLSKDTFIKLLEKTHKDPKTFMLINYEAHWSPLGRINSEDSTLTIFDVDWDERYSREYYYLPGEGEDTRDIDNFYRKWKSHRGILLITFQ